MIECLAVKKRTVQFHYDLSTLFYRLLWGEHIHHGWWQADERPGRAQVQLTEQLAQAAAIEGGEQVLDVGCGIGGSSMLLAREFDCRVVGITLSPFQRRWASAMSRLRRLHQQTEFRCVDAEKLEWEASSFDIVWSIECTEHLFDKEQFFRRASTWLRPGGRMAICAWLAADSHHPDSRQMLLDVCEGFYCPSLGSFEDYRRWMTDAGLSVTIEHDWTEHVLRTWEICMRRVRRSGVAWLARLIDRDTARFLRRFQTIYDAYRHGVMQYGCIVATKEHESA